MGTIIGDYMGTTVGTLLSTRQEKPAVPKEAEKKQPSSQPEVQAAPAPQAG